MHVYAHVEIVSTARNPYTGPGCPWIDLRGPIDNNTRRNRARKQIETCCTDIACHCARYQKFGRREVPAEDESRTRTDGERGMRRARATRPGSAGHARALHYIMSRDASSSITLPRRRRVTSRRPPSRPPFAFCSSSAPLLYTRSPASALLSSKSLVKKIHRQHAEQQEESVAVASGLQRRAGPQSAQAASARPEEDWRAE